MRKYVVTVTFLLLIASTAFVIFSPGDRESVLAENREPQEMPAFSVSGFVSGEFASLTDSCIDDNIGFRSELMELSNSIKSCFGFVPKSMGRIISTTKDIGTEESQESRLLIYNNNIMEMFESQPDTEQNYAAALNDIRGALPEDVAMYSMLVPTRLEFCGGMYSGAEDSQKDTIENVYSMFDEGIVPVDVYGKLSEGFDSGEDYLYFMTDHHWNMDGAYYGYTALAEAAEFDPVSRDDFPKETVGEFYGSLYLKAKSQLDDQPADIMEYYDVSAVTNFETVMRSEDNVTEYSRNAPIFRPENENYNVFFGGDHPVMEITNMDMEEGETLVVIKDSYACALLPWMFENYKKTIVIDPRSYGGNLIDEVEESGADDVVVVNYIFTTTFSDYCDMLRGLL